MNASRHQQLPLLPFFRLFTLRHARREWLQTTLMLAILALGVGTFLSIRMANRAAVNGFELFTDSLKGPSDWILRAPGGNLPVADLPKIRRALGDLPVYLFPVVESRLQPLPDPSADTTTSPPAGARLLGLDLVQFRSVAAAGNGNSSPPAWLESDQEFWNVVENPRHVLLSPELANDWSVAKGDELAVVLKGEAIRLQVAGILPDTRTDSPLPRDLAVMDLSALLALLEREGVDRVEGIIPTGPRKSAWLLESLQRLTSTGPSSWLVSTPAENRREGRAMTAAFRLNLIVLSLIALLTGLYLIAQTLDATVSRRRSEIATLRSLGVTPRRIYQLWLAEAFLYSLFAGLLGIALGYGMAFFTVEAVTGTVRALYQDSARAAVALHPADAGLALLISMGGGLLAAYLPARDAAGTPPAQQLRLGRRIPPFPLFQHPRWGLFALMAGGALAFLPPLQTADGARIPLAGYATAFFFLVGGTLVAVKGLPASGFVLHRLAGSRPAPQLGSSRLRRPTSRHQLALAGFVVALTMASSMSFLIQSFESTITGWLNQRLQGDLFLSSSGFSGNGSDQRMSADLLRSIENRPGVASLHRSRSVRAPLNGVQTDIYGMPLTPQSVDKLILLQGSLDPPKTDEVRDSGPAVSALANESLARRRGLTVGDSVQLLTPKGEQTVRIHAIHAEYSSDRGQLLLDLRWLREWFGVDSFDTATVYLHQEADLPAFQQALRADYPGLSVRDNAELLRNALFLFHQTFAVTKALQFIALVVALAGLALSMVSLLRESSSEIALQRTLGMSRHEIAMAGAFEGLGVALSGLLGGLAMGAALGMVLIHVINRQSFGWTLQTRWPVADAAWLAAAVILLSGSLAYLTTRLFLRRWSFRSAT